MLAANCGEYEKGEMEEDNFSDDGSIETSYTNPEEAKIFADETNVDILAVSVGTIHGLPDFKVKIDIKRLNNIKRSNRALLSIHDGSGLPEEEIIKIVKVGISKINIGADLYRAITNHVRKLVIDNKIEMIWNFRNNRVIENITGNYIRLFNSFRK